MEEAPTPTKPPEAALRPVPTCCACLVKQGRLLLILRAREPGRGNWSFPGGRLELGETVFQAVTWEVREETGLEIEPLRIFQVYDWITRDDRGDVRWHYVVNYVLARALSGEPQAGDDAADLRWVTLEELSSLPMHPFVRQTALRLFQDAESRPE